jgi:hypothetical protein
MPRLSSAALGVVPAYAPELPPPAHLNEAEKAVFRDIVAAADSSHFRPEDRELLGLYCIHVIEGRRLADRKRRSPEHQRELRETTKLVMSLATKLRLGPKSRAPDHRRAASAGSRSPPSYYDQMELERRQAQDEDSNDR